MQNQPVHPLSLVLHIGELSKRQAPPTGKEYSDIKANQCLIFKNEPDQYGEIMFNHKRLLAHRVIYEAAVGELLDEDMVVRHRCDHPGCVEVSHLISGTHKDNYLDTQIRKRNPAFGSRNGAILFPDRLPRGIRRYGCVPKIEVVADIKSSLANYPSPTRSDFVSVAAHFSTTPDQVEAIHGCNDFVNVAPSAKKIEIQEFTRDSLTVEYANLRAKKLAHGDVADIRYEFFISKNCEKRKLKIELRERYDITKATLQNVLNRKTFKDVAPEIPVTNEAGSGVAVLSDSEVQSIRATWTAFPQLQGRGLAAALARYFAVSHPTVDRIVTGDQRADVGPDPDKSLTEDELKPMLKALNQSGENHHNAKLNEEKVRAIRKLKAETGITDKKIAEMYGVTKETIGNVVCYRTWKDVD